jgi:hypothetical protein
MVVYDLAGAARPHVEIGPRDRVFRHSRMRASIVWLAGFAATAAFFFNAYLLTTSVIA